MGTTAGEITFDELKRMTDSHVCAQCEGRLITVWNAECDDYELVCGRNRQHQGYRAVETLKQELARGQGDKLLGAGAQQDIEKQVAVRPGLISRFPNADIATRKELAPAMVAELQRWATQLGLNADLGHVCLYHGKPYVTIDGYYYLLNKTQPEVKIGCRPCTADERKALQAVDTDTWWIAEAWAGGTRLPTLGYGLVTAAEQNEMSEKHPGEFRAPVVHTHPQRMTEKRAEWQLLRKLIPLAIEP